MKTFPLFNPLARNITFSERMVRVILLTYTSIYLYNAYSNRLLIEGLVSGIVNFNFYNFFLILTVIFTPVAIFLFLKRHWLGWFLFLIPTAITVINGILYMKGFLIKDIFADHYSFDRPSASSILTPLLISAGFLYILCKCDVMEKFKAGYDLMYFALGLALVIVFVIQ